MDKERLREKAQPLIDIAFGKNLPDHLKKKDADKPTVRPVGLIVEDLCQLPDEAWAKYAFSREPLNGRLTDPLRVELGAKASECGRETARAVREQYGDDDLAQIAEKMNLKVDYPDMPQNASRVLFAEFVEPDKIHIYMDGVRKGRALLEEPGVRRALGRDFEITSLLLGHEIFHKIELTQKNGLWTNAFRLRLWQVGPIHNDSKLVALGEIAAMAFTQELNGLSWSPYVMDAFLVYGYTAEAASALYEEMMEYAGLTPRL